MKNLINKLLGVVLLISFFSFGGLVFAQDQMQLDQISATESAATPSAESVDVNELFWPVAAGRTMGDSLYFLKNLKEQVGEFFSFGDMNKADFNTTLSEKRVVEANSLYLQKKDYENGKKTLEQSQIKRQKALDHIKIAKESKRKTEQVEIRFVNSLNNQIKLLEYLQSQIPEDQRQIFTEQIDKINSSLSEIK